MHEVELMHCRVWTRRHDRVGRFVVVLETGEKWKLINNDTVSLFLLHTICGVFTYQSAVKQDEDHRRTCNYPKLLEVSR